MPALSKRDGQRLVRFARRCIAAHFEEPALLCPGPDPPVAEPEELGGVFVTLRRDRALRGCMGVLGADSSLLESLRRASLGAATKDPRFPPVEPNELNRLELSVSVLSPPAVVTDVGTIEIGRDGLIVSLHEKRGLLLPDVAVQRGWDRATFLSQTCQKAGLPAERWREPGLLIWRFTTISFGEN